MKEVIEQTINDELNSCNEYSSENEDVECACYVETYEAEGMKLSNDYITKIRQSEDKLLSNIKPLSIPTNAEERLHVTNKFGHGSHRHKILQFIHSKPIEYTLLILLMLDVIILFFELFLSAEFPLCPIIERNAISCCPTDADGSGGGRWLASTSKDESICEEPYVDSPNYAVGCVPHEHWLHSLHTAFFSMTIIILSIFVLEHMLLIFCLGPIMFFKRIFYCIDLFVVTVSLVLEIIFYTLNDEILQSITGILIIIRAWRFIRVGHGIIESTYELTYKKFHKVVTYNERLEQLIKDNNITIPKEWKNDMKKVHDLNS